MPRGISVIGVRLPLYASLSGLLRQFKSPWRCELNRRPFPASAVFSLEACTTPTLRQRLDLQRRPSGADILHPLTTLACLQPQATHGERAVPADRTSARCGSADSALTLFGGDCQPSRSSMTACFWRVDSHLKSMQGVGHEPLNYPTSNSMPRDSFAGASAFLQA